MDKRQAEAVPTLNQIDTSAASIDSLDDEDFSFDLVPGDDCKDSLLAVQRLPVEDLFRPVCEVQQIDETSGKTINWDDIDNLSKAGTSTTTPTETGGFRLTEEACSRWVRDVLSQGGCEYHDIDVLVWLSAGVGDREILHTNLQREIEACGLIVERLSDSAVSSLAANIDNIDAMELVDSLLAVAGQSNRVLGDRRIEFTKEREAQLVYQLTYSQSKILKAIASSRQLLNQVATWVENALYGKNQAFGTLTAHNAKTSYSKSSFEDTITTIRQLIAQGKFHDTDQALHQLKTFASDPRFCTYVTFELEPVDVASNMQDLRLSLLRYRRAFDELLHAHLPLARKITLSLDPDADDLEDLVQSAILFLVHSIWRFDPVFGHRLGTYASRSIWQALNRLQRDSRCVVRIPDHRRAYLDALDSLIEESEKCGLPRMRRPELAAASGLSIEQLEQYQCYLRVEEPLTEIVAIEEGNQGFELSLEAQRSKAFREIIAGLPHELRDIIIKRYGLESRESMTLAEIGLEYGVTRERIRQIQQKALKKLSKPAYSDILSEYR